MLHQVEGSWPRTWIDELAACAGIHERFVWRVAGPVADALAVHGDELDGHTTDVNTRAPRCRLVV